MMWINLERFIKWKSSLQNGLLWHTSANKWRWRVYRRYNDGSRKCVTFRLLSPEGRAYEQTTYSVEGYGRGFYSDQMVAEAIMEIIRMKENKEL